MKINHELFWSNCLEWILVVSKICIIGAVQCEYKTRCFIECKLQLEIVIILDGLYIDHYSSMHNMNFWNKYER